jgi:PST family polysaccharide transporter
MFGFKKILTKPLFGFGDVNSKNVFKNIGWLLFDRAFRMGLGLIIGTWLARYLGPDQFGILNYFLAIIAIFSIVSLLGLDSIAVKEFVENQQNSEIILFHVFFLRLLAGIGSFIVCAGFIFYLKISQPEMAYVGIVLSFSLVFQSLSSSLDLYFQSRLLSKFTVYAQNIAFVIASGVKVFLIVNKDGLLAFALVTIFEAFLNSVFLYLLYLKVTKTNFFSKFDFQYVLQLLKRSWPLAFSGLLIMIYMRIDQIMLGEISNNTQAGIYSAALKLSEIWYFLPVVICNSYFPMIITAKRTDEIIYIKKVQKLLDLLFLMAFGLSVFASFFSSDIINILYGIEYKESAIVLSIHIWTSIFVFLGVAGSNYFVVENLQTKMLVRAGLGLILNVALNLIFIPWWGAVGAAIATLTSQFFASYFFDLLSKQTRAMFKMKTNALIAFNYLRKG